MTPSGESIRDARQAILRAVDPTQEVKLMTDYERTTTRESSTANPAVQTTYPDPTAPARGTSVRTTEREYQPAGGCVRATDASNASPCSTASTRGAIV